MKRLVALLCLLSFPATAEPITVGSKTFTENIILGDILTGLLTYAGYDATHRRNLGGTRVVFEALRGADIDLYVDYTGTVEREILAGQSIRGEAKLRAALADMGIGMSASIGFNNTYAIAVREGADTSIRTITDLKSHPEVKLGLSNEFLDRGDGWRALKAAYGLPQTDVTGLEHELAYRALESGSIDAMDVYSTDANIARYGLRLLEDDRHHFPNYDAVILYRLDLAPAAIVALDRLSGTIDEQEMVVLNARVTLEGATEREAAAEFLADRYGIEVESSAGGLWSRLWRNTLAHLTLVAISLSAAILIAIPLGIAAFRRPRAGHLILGAVGIAQTIPSLALFVFMIPLVGIGGPPAMIALFFYSLLPIVRNTHAGLNGIAPPLRESATALGLPRNVILRKIELPLAAPSILSGIKTAAVINVGTATLGALIGAGGYGQPILTGIRLADTGLILEGAIPAALLALATQGLFELLERAVVPAGLRLSRSGAGA